MRNIENLFGDADEKDYYKPVKTKAAFNDNYVEYERSGDKDKNLSLEEYLDMIRPYLQDLINNHKATIKLKDRSVKIINDDTYGEWKIQLTIQINFISSLDPKEIRTMDSMSANVVILMGSERNDIISELFESFYKDIRKN